MSALKQLNLKVSDISFALLMCLVLFLLIFKLHPTMLDMLLVVSISSGFLILLLTMYVDSPLKLASFPTILLVMTLFRLGLNVASTKLILLDGAAGEVINTFGNFVIQGNYIVGTVIFLILVMIQFKVITEGSGRIAEVSARFTLDAMPGKQMSIDADLNAGIIDEKEAQEKRQALNDEAAFYGSMDGANKFVKGDVMAGLIITGINIAGGLLIGIVQKDLEFVEALEKYTILTIGDGLVSQIPSLVISLSAGILVTRANGKGPLGGHITEELFGTPAPLFICSGLLTALAVMPGLPFFPFAVLASGIGFAGYKVSKKERAEEQLALDAKQQQALGINPNENTGVPPALPGSEEAEKKKYLPDVNPMALEIGFSLVPLVDDTKEGDLIERIGNIRQQIIDELGFRMPPISVNDNIELGNSEYRILIRGLEQARGNIHINSQLAINPGDVIQEIEGIRTKDPAFGFDAIWINESKLDQAESYGYTVVDPASVITTHITKIVKDHAGELVSRQDVSTMIDHIKESNPAVIEELVPEQLNLGVIHRVIQSLLREQVPIHDLPLIFETLSDYSVQSKDPLVLSEFCRQALRGHITSEFLGDGNTLYAMTLHPETENELVAHTQTSQNNSIGILSLSPERADQIVEQISLVYDSIHENCEADLTLLVSPVIRLNLQQLVSRKIPDLPVLSYAEISDELPVEILASVNASAERTLTA